MKEIVAWTVKTRTGIIVPQWMFDNEQDALDFREEISEKLTPHKYYVAKVKIKLVDDSL